MILKLKSFSHLKEVPDDHIPILIRVEVCRLP